MPKICHLVGFKEAPHVIMDYLTTLDGLKTWWTSTVFGDPRHGGQLEFEFGDAPAIQMRVLEADVNKVVWQVTSGPYDWMNTELHFTLMKEDETLLIFQHRGWQDDGFFFHFCSTKWATLLTSLKDAVEKGQGSPFPNDRHITTTMT